MPDKVDQLYDALKADGAVSKSRENFRSYMLAPGKEGYNNRLQLYKALSADGAVQSKTYEEFRDKLGIGAVNPQRKQQASAAIGGNNMTNWANPVDVSTAGMSAWERERQPKTTAEAPLSAHTGNGKPQKVKTQVQQQADDLNKAMAGDKEAAKRSGLTTAAERMKDELDYLNATGEKLRNKIELPGIAPTLARDENGNVEVGEDGKPLVGVTSDEKRVAQYQQQLREDRRRETEELARQAVAEIERQQKDKAWDAYQQNKKGGEFAPTTHGLNAESFSALRAISDVNSPEAILDRLNQLYGYETQEEREKKDEELRKQGKSTVLAHWDDNKKQADFASRFLEDNREKVEETAAKLGMSVDDYVLDELIPTLSESIAKGFEKNMSERYSVKGTADYLTREMSSSILGTLATMSTTSKKARQYSQEELQKSREGLGEHYNASFGSRLAGETLMFAGDAPALTIGAGIGGFTAKMVGEGLIRLGATQLGTMVATGSPFLAANVGRAVKYGGAAIKGALGMMPFMGTSSAVQDLSVGDGTLVSVGKAFLEGSWEGAKFGGALGVLGTASAELGQSLNLGYKRGETSFRKKAGGVAKKATYLGASFLAENQIIASLDYIKDPENFNWTESSANAFYMMAAGKLSSGHGFEEMGAKFADLFRPKRDSRSPIVLTDVDKKYISDAFGGEDFTTIAGNVENIGKILEDKQAIPWTTRQKVSGQTMGTFESSRPRTDRILVMDKMIDERAEDNELIETHTFNTEDEKQSILQKIREKRNNDDMLSDYGILKGMKVREPNEVEIATIAERMLEENPNLSPEDVEKGGKSYDIVVAQARKEHDIARRVIREFAVDYNMSSEEVEEIMRKDPVERTDEEYELMNDLASRFHAEAHPKGEFHPSQSRIDGRKLAGDDGVVTPEAAENVAQEMRDADEAYYDYLNSHEKMREAVEEMGNARPDEIYMHIYNNYSGTERDEFLPILANRINAQAKQDGFVTKVGENIEDTVQQEIDRYSFKGKIDDSGDTENIITFTHKGKEYTMLNGQVGTRREPGVVDPATGVATDGVQKVDPENSGDMIIALDENNNWVFLKPDANMQLRYESKADFSARRSEELGVQDTQTLVEAGVVRPEEKKQGGNQDNADVEASAKDTGADEAPAAAPSAQPFIGTTSIDDVAWGSTKRKNRGTLNAKEKDGVITFDIDGHKQSIRIDGKDWVTSEEEVVDGQVRNVGLTKEELEDYDIDENAEFTAQRIFKSNRDGKWYAEGYFLNGKSKMDGQTEAVVELSPEFDINNALKSHRERTNKLYDDYYNRNEGPLDTNPVSVDEVTDKDGIKRYENGVTAEDAVADMISSGDNPIEIADASIAEADEIINKINNKNTKTRKDLENRKKNQRIKDYYEGIKNGYKHIDRADGTSVTTIGERTIIEKDGKIIYDSAGKLAPVPPVTEGKESINNVVNNNNEPQKTVTLQPKVATQPKEIDAERVKRESGTPEGRKSLLDRKKNDYATRWKIAKLIYGDLFDEDSSVANSVEEVISMNLLHGRSLDPDSFAKELGWDMRVGRDAAKVSTMFDKRRENGGEGTTFNKVVHDIWESPENTVDGEKRFSTEDIRNALIAMFNEARDKWDITEWPLKNRIEQAEKLLREEQERINDEKVLGEEPIVLTDEEIERITKELPFEMSTEEDIPDSPITQLEKTARELMGEEGTPNIHVINTDRMSADTWRKMLEDEFDVFLSDEEVGQLREERMREGVYYNEETGKITVFSGELTPDELR